MRQEMGDAEFERMRQEMVDTEFKKMMEESECDSSLEEDCAD